MLFFLTGDIQTGKTRWLQALVAELEAAGTDVTGVLAPGVWELREQGTFEKLGIRNVLLPGGEDLSFAVRGDLVEKRGPSQSLKAQLVWDISDEAIARVNAHFDGLAAQASTAPAAPEGQGGGLLVIDELGRLELLCGGGLTSAVALLDAGPTPRWPHALAVVRPDLLDLAKQRFAPAWREIQIIQSNDDARTAVVQMVAGARSSCP